ncbi:MAG TPA: nickel-responsive transcriptional regulator NikR [Methylococcaceae bacterium]|nr:nickel-responsive transcriptional regulator NikR [Methylococcaceae bacterium]
MVKSGQLMRFGVSMEDDLLEKFDSLCAARGYGNRSEAIRDMVRDLLIESALREENTEGVGTLTLVYDHHHRELEEKLTDYQHEHLKEIISTVHVHLNRHLCLEVLILRGKVKEIRKVADGLIATKGVQHGKLVLTTAGREAR